MKYKWTILAVFAIAIVSTIFAFAADTSFITPNEGEQYSTDSIEVEWNCVGDEDDALYVEYSIDGEEPWIEAIATTCGASPYTLDVSGLDDSSEFELRLVNTGNSSDNTVYSGSFTIDREEPEVDLSIDSIFEDDYAYLDASDSEDGLTGDEELNFTWDINGQVVGPSTGESALNISWDVLQDRYNIDNNDTYDVTVTVTDLAGNENSTTESLVVYNTAPTGSIETPEDEVTDEISLTYTYEDVADHDESLPLTCELTWYATDLGTSGTIDSDDCDLADTTWNTIDVPNSASTYLEINITDDGDTTSYVTGNFLVDNENPVIDSLNLDSSSLLEGQEVELTLDVRDDEAGVEGSEFNDSSNSFWIDWGDDTYNWTDSLTISHTYADEGTGTYTITVNATDDVNLTTSNVTSVTVSNVAPVVIAGSDVSGNEGEEVTISATFTDVGVDDYHNVTVYWGDGNSTSLENTTSPIEESHIYEDEGTGSYTVTIVVQDNDGGISSDDLIATISNVVPTIELTAPTSTYLGGEETIAWTVGDQGTADSVTVDLFYALGDVSSDCGVSSSGWETGSDQIDSVSFSAVVDNSSTTNWDTSALTTDGEYSLCALATDIDGGENASYLGVFIVDNTAPETAAVEASIDTFRSGAMLYFSAASYDVNLAGAYLTIFDDNSDAVSAYTNLTLNASDASFDESYETIYTFETLTLNEGTYTYEIVGYDLSGNVESQDEDNVGSFVVSEEADDPRYTDEDIDAMIDALNTTIQTLEDEVDDLSDEVDAVSDVADANADDIVSLNSTLTGVEDDISDLWDFVDALETNDTSLQSQIDDLQTDLSSVNGTVTTLSSTVDSLSDEFDAYTVFVVSQSGSTTDADGDYVVTIDTTSSAICTITDVFEGTSDTMPTTDDLEHTYTFTDQELGMNIYTVSCESNTYGWSKQISAYVNVVGFYNLFIADGGNDGFLARVQSFIVSYAELVAAGLTSFDVDSVLTSTDGPSDMALDTSSDVDMLWAYNGTTWSSYNVTNSSGDFTGFDATDVPVYYWMTLEDSAAGKAIIH